MRTAFTQGGRREAEIATPTSDDWFPDKRETATAAPDGKATSIPIQRVRSWPLATISDVGHTLLGFHSRVKFSEMIPKTKPVLLFLSVRAKRKVEAATQTEDSADQEAKGRVSDSQVTQVSVADNRPERHGHH